MTIDTFTSDKRVIDSISSTKVVALPGTTTFNFTFTRLRKIEKVINYTVTKTSPLTNAGTVSYSGINGNVVGMTLQNVGSGTTISATMTVLGF